MVAYADLVLPDTTYLERFDAISLLDRPISDADGAADAIRHPVLQPNEHSAGPRRARLPVGAARPGRAPAAAGAGAGRWLAEVSRLRRLHRQPRARAGRRPAGRLARRRRLAAGQGRAESASSCSATSTNGGFWRAEMPRVRALLQDGQSRLPGVGAAHGLRRRAPTRSCCSCIRKRCRNSASPRRATARCSRRTQHRERVATYFDPLPIWYEPFERDADVSRTTFPLTAVTQRPMFMYHAWGSQNAWLRQIATRNFLYLHPDTGARHGIADDDWVERGLAQRPHHACRRSSPPTCSRTRCGRWNAIGKRKGAWKLAKDAPEVEPGLPAQPPDFRHHPERRLRQRRSGHRAGGVVRPARAHPQGGSQPTNSAPQFEALAGSDPDSAPLRFGAQFRRTATGTAREPSK